MNQKTVDSHLAQELVEVIAEGWAGERARLERALVDPIKPMRPLYDTPFNEYMFRPWITPGAGAAETWLLVPAQPDAAPMSRVAESDLAALPYEL